MAKSEKQRLKILYILKYLTEKSDVQHPLSVESLIQLLEQDEIHAERKSIYSDIALLSEFGYQIGNSKKKGASGYYLIEREFELPELKLLVDAVQASRFMTAKKSSQLITKLEKQASPFEAKQLQRQVFVSDRVKNENESIYETVDVIHRAMQDNHRIGFRYYEWGVDKQMHFRKNGTLYDVSPFFLIWKDENYYLVAYDALAEQFKHYRVDKMADMQLLDQPRQGNELAAMHNPATYAKKVFGMFAGESQTVTIQFPESMSGVMFDRFGKDVSIRKRAEGIYSLRVDVDVSYHFFGWLTGLGHHKDIRILGPQDVVQQYEDFLSELLGRYQENDES